MINKLHRLVIALQGLILGLLRRLSLGNLAHRFVAYQIEGVAIPLELRPGQSVLARKLLLTCLIWSVVPLASAGIITFSDRGAFVTAVGSTQVIDFSSAPSSLTPIDPGRPTGHQVAVFSGVQFEPIYWVAEDPNSSHSGFIYSAPQDQLRVTLPSGTHAAGADLAPFFLDAGTYTVGLSTGATYTMPEVATTLPSGFATPTFFGVISDQPLDWMTFNLDSTSLVLDNFTTSTPEPTCVTCASIGLLLLALMKRGTGTASASSLAAK